MVVQISALGNWRQEDQEFKVVFSHIVSLRQPELQESLLYKTIQKYATTKEHIGESQEKQLMV